MFENGLVKILHKYCAKILYYICAINYINFAYYCIVILHKVCIKITPIVCKQTKLSVRINVFENLKSHI